MMAGLNAFTIMVYRQLKRFIRARSRIVALIVQPVMWIFLFGMGMGGVFSFNNPMIEQFVKQQFGGLDYITFLTTGVIGMSVFMGSFLSGISVIWDKQFGFLKETLVAPAPRSMVILGRIFGDALIVLLQASIIALIARTVSPTINILYLPIALIYGMFLALGFTSAGIALALKMRSMEGFQMIINFIMMPVMFLSGIFFPVDRMPDWAQLIARINPLTYAVDGIRYWLTGTSLNDPLVDLAVLVVISAILMLIAVKLFEKTTIED